MKINSEMRFPHPVLWTETTDYSQGTFGIALNVAEDAVASSVELNCQIALTESAIQTLCSTGQASIGVSVVCLDTYYNRLFEVPLTGGPVAIGAGQLRGQVTVRPIIWAKVPIMGFSSPNIHNEFGTAPFSFAKSAILALGDESVIDVGTEKLAPIGSVFTLARDDEVPENEVAAQTEEEKIQILACANTLEWINHMRNTNEGRAILLNSVYLPVVMTVLDTIRQNDPVNVPKRWHRVFTAKLTTLGLSADTGDLLETAQALLKSPLAKLDSLLELK